LRPNGRVQTFLEESNWTLSNTLSR
jgi:hypothetical protein